MCKEVNFYFDNCKCRVPLPARTVKCSLARARQDCHTETVLVALSSKKCSLCLGKKRLRELVENKGLHVEDRDAEGHWGPDRVSLTDLMREAGHESPKPPRIEKRAERFFLDRCFTWPLLNHRLKRRPDESIIWDMPTRCFINVGFLRLDPWAADREKLRLDPIFREPEARLDQAGLRRRRRRSLPDLRHVPNSVEPRLFVDRREPSARSGSCCEEARRQAEAQDPSETKSAGSANSMESTKSSKRGALIEWRRHDDWCTSTF